MKFVRNTEQRWVSLSKNFRVEDVTTPGSGFLIEPTSKVTLTVDVYLEEEQDLYDLSLALARFTERTMEEARGALGVQMKEVAKTRWPPPYEFSDRVCDCKDPKGHTTHANGFANACSTCGKYFRYVVFTCSVCHSPYLQTYKHPYRCLEDARCPEHLREAACDHPRCRELFGKQTTHIREEDRYPLPEVDFTLTQEVDPITVLDF